MRGKWADRFTQLTPRLLNIVRSVPRAVLTISNWMYQIPRPESMHDDEGAQIRTTSERQVARLVKTLNNKQRMVRCPD